MRFIPFLLSSILSLTSAAEISDANKYDCRPCQERCPLAIAEADAPLLLNSFIQALNDNNLNKIQAFKAPKATFRAVLQNGPNDTCTNTGEVEFLGGLVPILGEISITGEQVLENAYVDAKGRIIAFTLGEQTIDSVVYNIMGRFVLEPVLGSCSYRIAEYSMRDANC